MRKEVLVAIAAGLILGLVIAFGVWRVNLALSPTQDSGTASSSPTPNPEFALTIAKPSSNDVITEGVVTLSGITKPGSFVTVSAEEDDYVITSDSKGAFEQEIELAGGVNQIIVTAFDEKGYEVGQELLVVYSSEFAKYISDKQDEEAGEATSSVRDRVMEKVNQALNSPKALLGTVTDIAEKTIQIKTLAGEIEQLSTDPETSAVNIGVTTKEVKVSDVAIGDFIVAMGFTNGNGVLSTKRILITSPLAKNERKAVFLKVIKNNTKDLLTQYVKSQEEQKLIAGKNASVLLFSEGKTTKLSFSALTADSLIIAFGTPASQDFTARSIVVISKP